MYRVIMYMSGILDTDLLGFIDFDSLVGAKQFCESFTREHPCLCLEVKEVENEDK